MTSTLRLPVRAPGEPDGGTGAHRSASSQRWGRRLRRPSAWTVAVAAIAAAVLAPVVALVASVVAPESEVWSHLWATRLPGMLVTTTVLVTVVSVAAAVLGTSLAWLVAAHRFVGRGVLAWLLALPLAIPAYVSGFVVLDTFDRSGPVRAWWTDLAGSGGWYPEVRSLPFAAVVLTLALYPYVYLLALGAFRDQAATLVDAARTLGCSPLQAFRRVALPAARPAVIAGSVLVALEVLTDVGTVRLFNVSTLTDGVFRVWFDLGQREAATELAGLLLLGAVAILLAERRAGSTSAAAADSSGTEQGSHLVPARLGRRGAAAVLGAWLVVGAALVFPLTRLALWAREAVERGRTASVAGGVGHHLGSSLAVSGATVAACCVLGVLVALAARWVPGRGQAALTTATTLGYGLPGPVIALGVLVCLAAIDRTEVLPDGVLVVGSFAGLVSALVVRYLALAVKPSQESLGRVGRSTEEAARGLGASRARVVGRIQLPLARSGLLVAAALVALDATKELPATLLLRPFGVDTLPIWVWQATSDSRWVEAGLPSLILVGVAAVPTMVLVSLMMRGRSIDL